MKNIILIGIAIVAFIGLILTSVLYHDSYEKEKADKEAALKKVKELEVLVAANEENKPEILNEVADEFIETFFYSDGTKLKEKENKLKSMMTESSFKKLYGQDEAEEDDHSHPMEGLEQFESKANIKESIYNRTSDTEATVVITFEHVVDAADTSSKTLNEATVKLLYVDGDWKVDNYEIVQLL